MRAKIGAGKGILSGALGAVALQLLLTTRLTGTTGIAGAAAALAVTPLAIRTMVAVAGLRFGGLMMIAIVTTATLTWTAIRALAARLALAGFQFTHHRCRLRQATVAAIVTAAFRPVLAYGPITTNDIGAMVGTFIAVPIGATGIIATGA